MQTPDEVRAERIGFYRVEFAKQMIRDDRPEAMSEFFASALEALYQSAYASGSAARRDAIVKMLKNEANNLEQTFRHKTANGVDYAIERIEKE